MTRHRLRPGLMLLRVLSVLLLVGPPLAVGGVWTWMALSGLSNQRRDIFEFGQQAIVLAMGLGLLGLLAEFLILPILLNDGETGRADAGD
ncbi:hypothetical protein QO010_001639 [Caulobacter ginsengisoli]|uniref:Uncharacterized protein n=1 Tax=Caulobacter ginsengisoli TaxID=400775 RepID=A0ABU0IPD5_9CAUL|nr:hypothetical protein [Caulobacter ginsengisoli]MDQ0463868.1 hypothetical protein [Caulobacter ginsengisoli]